MRAAPAAATGVNTPAGTIVGVLGTPPPAEPAPPALPDELLPPDAGTTGAPIEPAAAGAPIPGGGTIIAGPGAAAPVGTLTGAGADATGATCAPAAPSPDDGAILDAPAAGTFAAPPAEPSELTPVVVAGDNGASGAAPPPTLAANDFAIAAPGDCPICAA